MKGTSCYVMAVTAIFIASSQVVRCFTSPSIQESSAPQHAKRRCNFLGRTSTTNTYRAAKIPFECSWLCSPMEISLPPILTQCPSEFVCEDGWLDLAMTTISCQLERHDDSSYLVPFMALVRCSHGGKTRTLLELAYALTGSEKRELNAIYVAFSHYSAVTTDDDDDPLQALCQRIVFAAIRGDNKGDDLIRDYEAFRRQNYDIDPFQLAQWLGDARVVLLVDDVNNLVELSAGNSEKAAKLGDFIKETFLAPAGRFCIFTSHQASTISSLRRHIDRSIGRGVIVQSLPRITNLSRAGILDPHLRTTGHAVYFNLIPGLIRDHCRGEISASGRLSAVRAYNDEAHWQGAEESFKLLLRSVVSGEIWDVAKPLHTLLDTGVESGEMKVRWILYHLEYLLYNAAVDNKSWLAPLKSAMADLCNQLLTSKASPEEEYKTLFTLMYLIRSICRCPDEYFLPKSWTDTLLPFKVVFNVFNETAAGKPMDKCGNWEQLRRGIEGADVGKDRTVVILYPCPFRNYDMLAAYMKDTAIVDCQGFQLDASLAHPMSMADAEVQQSFFLAGIPPTTETTTNGWNVASGESIDHFYSSSGQFWKPQQWKLLSDSFSA